MEKSAVNKNDIMDALVIWAGLAIVGFGLGMFFAGLILPFIFVLSL